jgi:hypothetical protein
MAAQLKTQQKTALITRSLSKEGLLDKIATGTTIRQLAAELEILTGQTITPYYVCKCLQSFGDEYTEAKKAQAQYQAERVAEIADKVENGTLDPASARISSDNRKWVASKLDPSTYGDRVAMDVALTDVTQLHLASLRDAMKVVSTQDKLSQ